MEEFEELVTVFFVQYRHYKYLVGEDLGDDFIIFIGALNTLPPYWEGGSMIKERDTTFSTFVLLQKLYRAMFTL